MTRGSLCALGISLGMFAVASSCASGTDVAQEGSGESSSITTSASTGSAGGLTTSSADGSGGGAAGMGGAATMSTTYATTSVGDGGALGGGGTGGQGGAGGTSVELKVIGQECVTDADCASLLCKQVLGGSAIAVCVTPCSSQDDCPLGGGFFCEPTTAGATDGYCVPQSPSHCKTCTSDDECGSLSEACTQPQGDTVKACHVDCSIAGTMACPSDYSCTEVVISGKKRSLCIPPASSCLTSEGGFCDRVATPQSCVVQNSAGKCVGGRTCDALTERYSKCDVTAPSCLKTCNDAPPIGCTVNLCSNAVMSDPMNCGGCGTLCKGLLKTATLNVACESAECSYSCKGNNFDTNGNPADGCEVADLSVNHAKAQSAYKGSFDCHDPDAGSSWPLHISAKMVSDARVHQNPAMPDRNGVTGASSHWFRVYGDGGYLPPCSNDLEAKLQVKNSSYPSCYRLNVHTESDGSPTCATGSNGACTVKTHYAENSDIYLVVEKICPASKHESVSYTIEAKF